MKYWRVKAKCGHVKKTKYILKDFYVKAESGSEAAKIVRWRARVKHHDKKAIISTEEISEEVYLRGLKLNSADPYFNSHSVQEQRRMCEGIELETYYEESKKEFEKKTYARRHLIDEQLDREWNKGRNYCDYE